MNDLKDLHIRAPNGSSRAVPSSTEWKPDGYWQPVNARPHWRSEQPI